MPVAAVPIDVVESSPSTMDEARARVLSGRFRLDSPLVSCAGVMAREQTSGRGQRGRTWYAARDESLCATFMVCCPGVTHPAGSGHLGLLAGVAVASALVLRDVDHRIVGLKWPNDVMLNGRKAGGILVEMMRSPTGEWVALVGVGLNVSVSAFPEGLASSATSLLLEGVDAFDLRDLKSLAEDIGSALASWALERRTTPESVVRTWRRYFDATTGRRYETLLRGLPRTGTAEGIDDEGALLLRVEDGESIAVTSATSIREISA